MATSPTMASVRLTIGESEHPAHRCHFPSEPAISMAHGEWGFHSHFAGEILRELAGEERE